MSLADLRKFEEKSPVEVTRQYTMFENDPTLGRPALVLKLALGDVADVVDLGNRCPDRNSRTPEGQEQKQTYRVGIGTIAVKGWSGLTSETFSMASRWLLTRPDAMNEMPKDEVGRPTEVEFDVAGRNFFMEVIDAVRSNEIVDACVDTVAFAIAQQREKKGLSST